MKTQFSKMAGREKIDYPKSGFAVSELPPVAMYATTSDGAEWGSAYTSGNSIEDIIAAVQKSLGYVQNPLTKCVHCGQWGAVYCACPSCGAPIDPKE